MRVVAALFSPTILICMLSTYFICMLSTYKLNKDTFLSNNAVL